MGVRDRDREIEKVETDIDVLLQKKQHKKATKSKNGLLPFIKITPYRAPRK